MTQNERVKSVLDKQGYITRNHCFHMFPPIARLAARIDDLEREGYVFEGQNVGGDYRYNLITRPSAKQLTLI